MDPQGEKLDALSERIRQAEVKAQGKPEPKFADNVGFDFVGSIVGLGGVGWLMDRAFGTDPWCLLGMVLLGFIVGVASSWRALKKETDEK